MDTESSAPTSCVAFIALGSARRPAAVAREDFTTSSRLLRRRFNMRHCSSSVPQYCGSMNSLHTAITPATSRVHTPAQHNCCTHGHHSSHTAQHCNVARSRDHASLKVSLTDHIVVCYNSTYEYTQKGHCVKVTECERQITCKSKNHTYY